MSRPTHSVEELEIMAYLDGELSRERAATLAAHLEQCEECRRVAEDLRTVSKELATWPVETPELEITPRTAVALEDFERSQKDSAGRRRYGIRAFWRSHPRWAWGLTSGVVALLVAAVVMPNLARSRPAANQATFYSPSRTQSLPSGTETAYGYASETKRIPEPTISSRSSQHFTTAGLPTYDAKNQLTDTNKPDHEIPLPNGPMIVRTAQINLTTTEFDRARGSLEEILTRHNGYMGQLSVIGSADAARTLEAELRVPANQLDAALAEMKALGRVDSESQKGDEVTQQYVDLQARLKNSRNEEQRLIEILRQRTGKLSDVLAVEKEIASVREEIERMEAEKKTMEKQVTFSTVSMKISEDYKQPVHVVPDATSTRIRNAAVEGYETMVAGLVNVLLFLASWGPSLLLWGIILFFPARWLWRHRRKDMF